MVKHDLPFLLVGLLAFISLTIVWEIMVLIILSYFIFSLLSIKSLILYLFISYFSSQTLYDFIISKSLSYPIFLFVYIMSLVTFLGDTNLLEVISEEQIKKIHLGERKITSSITITTFNKEWTNYFTVLNKTVYTNPIKGTYNQNRFTVNPRFSSRPGTNTQK